MKINKIEKKIKLNKITVAILNEVEKGSVLGGIDTVKCTLPKTHTCNVSVIYIDGVCATNFFC